MLVALTLLPALLVICGRWVFWPKRPAFGSAEPTASGLWAKVGNRISVRPRAVWIGTAIVLAVACLGRFKLYASGLNSAEQYTKVFDSVKGQQVLTAHGFGDDSSPVQVVVNEDKADQVAAAMEGIPGLGETRRKALLRSFGSLKKLRAATIEEMIEVPGIGRQTAEAIAAALAADADDRPAAVNAMTGEVL